VAGVTESRGQKSDKRDTYGLAEKLRTGSLDKRIFKAPREFTLLRELSRAHITATRDLVRVQSRLKSLYRSRGIPTPGASVYSPAQRDAWEQRLPRSARRRARQLHEQLDFFREQRKRIEADLLRDSPKHRIVRILETAPGIGPIRAARLVPIVVTPHRFPTKRQFWSYCGLGIVTRSSSDWVQTADGGWIRARVPQTRGLSRQHSRVLKEIFKGAATLVITQRNKGPLYPRYERMLAGGTKPGSHDSVKNSAATRTPSTRPDTILHSRTESPVTLASSPRPEHARTSSTRGCRAHEGADARIEDAEAEGEVRLAFLPYGRRKKRAIEVR
jgi:hypothetical protein